MSNLIPLIILFCGWKIFCSKGEKRLVWFIGSLLLIYSSLTLLQKPHITSNYFFVICYLFSLIYYKDFSIKRTPFKKIWIVYIFGFFVIAIFSQHLTLFSKVYKPVSLLIKTYFPILLGFYSAKYYHGLDKKIKIILLFVCIYGLLTYLIKMDPIRQILNPGFLVDYYFGGRIRVASTWSHPIAYGFICSVFFLMMIGENRKIDRAVQILLVVSIVICGSRTVLGVFVLMMGVYMLMIGLKRKNLSRFALACVIAIFAVLCVPPVTERVETLYIGFTSDSRDQGSSLDMRQRQLDATLALMTQFPMTGGGFDYIQEVMGYGKNIDDAYWMKYHDFYGFESYLYILMIERGFIGIFIEITMILAILYWLYKRRNYERVYYARAMSILLGFITFSLSTGTLDIWILTMFFIGICMKKIEDGKNPERGLI